jgi:hypothetical protein
MTDSLMLTSGGYTVHANLDLFDLLSESYAATLSDLSEIVPNAPVRIGFTILRVCPLRCREHCLVSAGFVDFRSAIGTAPLSREIVTVMS